MFEYEHKLEDYAGKVIYRKTYEVADKTEILEFCNKVREIGGAEVLSALMPSTPNDSRACLVANNLNFNCIVVPKTNEKLEGSIPDVDTEVGEQWYMIIKDHSVLNKVSETLGLEVGCPYTYDFETESMRYSPGLKLPKHIGNAAYLFDNDHPEFNDLRLP